jgi:hypothetical protein
MLTKAPWPKPNKVWQWWTVGTVYYRQTVSVDLLLYPLAH